MTIGCLTKHNCLRLVARWGREWVRPASDGKAKCNVRRFTVGAPVRVVRAIVNLSGEVSFVVIAPLRKW